jgi:hypothetical protein
MTENFGLIPGRGRRFLSSPNHPDRLSGPPSLLFHGYWGCFIPGGKAAKVCTLRSHLMPRLTLCGSRPLFSHMLHGMMVYAQGQMYIIGFSYSVVKCISATQYQYSGTSKLIRVRNGLLYPRNFGEGRWGVSWMLLHRNRVV